MTLKETLSEDMKSAMRAKDSEKLATIRLINAAIKQREVDERIELGDDQVLSVIEKMIKQRKDSITQFEAGGRQDLADKANVRSRGASRSGGCGHASRGQWSARHG
jgi:uncharacterized protein YqeY